MLGQIHNMIKNSKGFAMSEKSNKKEINFITYFGCGKGTHINNGIFLLSYLSVGEKTPKHHSFLIKY